MNPVDEDILSRNLDGTLDYQSACTTAEQLAHDGRSRETMLEMLRVHALLGAYGHDAAAQPVPARLLETIHRRRGRLRYLQLLKRPLLQAAAAIAIVLAGYLAGRSAGPGVYPESASFPAIPGILEETVNTALEYEKSGSVRTWADGGRDFSASVTPVRTYRDGNGMFYRLYHVDVNQRGVVRHVAAIASRQENGRWLTRSVFSRKDGEKI